MVLGLVPNMQKTCSICLPDCIVRKNLGVWGWAWRFAKRSWHSTMDLFKLRPKKGMVQFLIVYSRYKPMALIRELFGEGRNLSVLQMGMRGILVFLIALVLIRISGRRSFGMR